MAVTKTCNTNNDAVELNKGEQQQLRYGIVDDPDVSFVLKDQQGATLLTSDASLRERLWPTYPGEVPNDDDVTHSLGMQFGATAELKWRVELVDANGALLSVVKDCRFRNQGGPDDHFNALRIVLV